MREREGRDTHRGKPQRGETMTDRASTGVRERERERERERKPMNIYIGLTIRVYFVEGTHAEWVRSQPQ